MTFARSLPQIQAQPRRRPGVPTVEASVAGEPLVSADLAHTLAAIRQQTRQSTGRSPLGCAGRRIIMWSGPRSSPRAPTRVSASVTWRDAQEAQAAAASLSYLLPPDQAA